MLLFQNDKLFQNEGQERKKKKKKENDQADYFEGEQFQYNEPLTWAIYMLLDLFKDHEMNLTESEQKIY